MEKTKLKLEFLSNKKAVLLQDYIYSINGYDIKVFRGFVTDGASVPKSLQWLYNPYGKYINAAVYTRLFILNNIIILEFNRTLCR